MSYTNKLKNLDGRAKAFMNNKRTPEEELRRKHSEAKAKSIREGFASSTSDRRAAERNKLKRLKGKRNLALGVTGLGAAATLGMGAKKLYDKAKGDIEKKAKLETRGNRVKEDAKTGAKIGAVIDGALGAISGGVLHGPKGMLQLGAAGAASGAIKGAAGGGLVGLVRKRKELNKD